MSISTDSLNTQISGCLELYKRSSDSVKNTPKPIITLESRRLSPNEEKIVSRIDSIVTYIDCYTTYQMGISKLLQSKMNSLSDTTQIKDLTIKIENLTSKYQNISLCINLLNEKLGEYTAVDNPLQISDQDIRVKGVSQPGSNFYDHFNRMLHIYNCANMCLMTLRTQTGQFNTIINSRSCRKLSTEKLMQLTTLQDHILDLFKSLAEDTIIGEYQDKKFLYDALLIQDSTPTLH